MTKDTPISKLLNPISDALINNPARLASIVLTGMTMGSNALLDLEIFDCPKEKNDTYGYLFLIAPCIILFFANMLVISETVNEESTIPSVRRVLLWFVAPVVWLIVSFYSTDYYVCAKVGPGPEKLNLTTKETKALEDRIAETKTESQIIAWALFIGMMFVTFVVIACSPRSKSTACFSRAYNTHFFWGGGGEGFDPCDCIGSKLKMRYQVKSGDLNVHRMGSR